MPEIHEYLAQWRKRADLTQEQVAELLGAQHPMISKWETGKVSPQLIDLERLARLYGAPDAASLLGPPPGDDVLALWPLARAVLGLLAPDTARLWLAAGQAMVAGGGRPGAHAAFPAAHESAGLHAAESPPAPLAGRAGRRDLAALRRPRRHRFHEPPPTPLTPE